MRVEWAEFDDARFILLKKMMDAASPSTEPSQKKVKLQKSVSPSEKVQFSD